MIPDRDSQAKGAGVERTRARGRGSLGNPVDVGLTVIDSRHDGCHQHAAMNAGSGQGLQGFQPDARRKGAWFDAIGERFVGGGHREIDACAGCF